MIKYEEIHYEIESMDGMLLVKPNGNILAENVSHLRIMLVKFLALGHTHFKFDLSRVDEIDSHSLLVLTDFSRMLLKESSETLLVVINAKSDIVEILSELDFFVQEVSTLS